MSVEAIERNPFPASTSSEAATGQGWFGRNRAAVVRHLVINFFMIIILAPLAWVLMMSIKSRADAMRPDFWPRKFDFTHYAYVFQKIDTLPINLFNSIYVIDDEGEIRDAYDKVHLVPFGEYLPVRGFLESLGIRQLIALPGGFAPGSRRRTMTVPPVPPFGPLICYEIVFPGEVIDPADRPRWLLNLTNDTWYGDTPGPYQHFAQARVRAVEVGLPLVRAANSGISAIVDPYGRIAASLPLGATGVVDGILPAPLDPTIQARFGDLVFLLLIAAAGTIVLTNRLTLNFNRN